MTENEISYKTIGAAIEIHKIVGPGLLESAYENALAFELKELEFDVKQQVSMPFIYKDVKQDVGYRIDLIVKHNPNQGNVCTEAVANIRDHAGLCCKETISYGIVDSTQVDRISLDVV